MTAFLRSATTGETTAILRESQTGGGWACDQFFHVSTMLSLRASHGMARGRQIGSKVGELEPTILVEVSTASSVVLIAYHGAGRETASGGGDILLETSISAGEVLELTRFRERWRFRSMLRQATVPSAEPANRRRAKLWRWVSRVAGSWSVDSVLIVRFLV